MRCWFSLALAIFIANAASPVLACETEPDLVRLPGETADAFEARLEKTHADQWVIRRYLRESKARENASTIYVARVVASNRGKATPNKAPALPRVTVQPLHSIRGSLPPVRKTLAHTNWASCGNYGDGDAAWASVGEIVLVFEGLPRSEQRPNGIDSLLASDLRTFELLDPLYQYGSENPF